MYKIFFKERVLLLTNQIDAVLTPDFSAIHKLGSEGELKKFIQDFLSHESHKEAYIYHHNEVELFRRLKKHFKYIPAAGGLVWDRNKKKFLGLHRRGCNDLPKGKLEKGETFETAAIREVSEECNIGHLQILRPLKSTFHIYHLNNLPILKETKWFEMIYHGEKAPSPQKEEDINQVKWIGPENIESFLENTYPSIKDLIKISFDNFAKFKI